MIDRAAKHRLSDRQVESVFLDRWSPRAFTSEEISEQELLNLLEAARWAPSAFNVQPWRFVYARRGTEAWPRFIDLLMEFNQVWARNAAALLFLVSDAQMRNRSGEWTESRTHSFDAGASWAYLALHATMRGWQAHGMTGIHLDKIRQILGIPEFYRIEAAIAIGRQGDPQSLSEKLRAREKPNPRRPLSEIVFKGRLLLSADDRERLR